MNAVISNASELLDKMIQYQEQLLNSLAMLAPHVEEVKRLGVDNISPSKTDRKQTLNPQ